MSYFISRAVGRGGDGRFAAARFRAFLMHDSDLGCTMAVPPSCNFKTFKLKMEYVDEFFSLKIFKLSI